MNRDKPVPRGRTDNLEFTVYARRSVERVTQDPYFRDSDPEIILDALMNRIRTVSFGDYLRRYIRRKQQQDDPFAEKTELEDTEYLCRAFRERNVPPSFTPTTAKLRALAKNWLTQRTVSRSAVLLLGFALEMSPEEVNEFLAKVLREPRLDPKDPFEVICWYCYRYRLPYSRFEALWKKWEQFAAERTEVTPAKDRPLQLDSTIRVRSSMERITSEEQLTAYLSRLGLVRASGRQSVSARQQFDRLYRKACAQVAQMKTEMERDDAVREASRYAEKIARDDRLYDYQKREQIRKRRDSYRTYTAEEITPADIENVLYSAVPKDRNGNLIPMKGSMLNLQFSGKRLNRQHMAEILEGSGAINRFDLITLSFFISAGDTDLYDRPRERYDAFICGVNQVLHESDMDPLYVTNPFESFVMMCMLTDDPLGSFADVWELSYQAGQEG